MKTNVSRIKAAGFTLVELVVVIAVLGILIAITTVSYRAIQDRAHFSTIDADMKGLKAAIEKHYAKNGSYPDTGGVFYYSRRDGDAFIPGLTNGYYSGKLPDVKTGSQTSLTDNTFTYRSNKVDYKLIRLAPAGVATLPPEAGAITPAMVDANATRAYRAWGYWTPGAASW